MMSSAQAKFHKEMYLVVTDPKLQALLHCSQISPAVTFVLLSSPRNLFCCTSSLCFPVGSLSQMLPLPTASLFQTPHSPLPVPAHWWPLCFSSCCSAVCSFWPLCSASPQILGLQLTGPVLSPVNFSMGFFCSPAQLLLSGLVLLHQDLRKKEFPSFQFPLLNLVPQKLLKRYEVWGIYEVQSISR